MKTNLLLASLALCLLLSAYTDRHSTQKTTSESETVSISDPLFPFHLEEIAVVKISDPQHCLLIRNSSAQSRPELTDPFLTALAQARVVRRFAVPSVDLSSYGLTATARRIEVLGANGQTLQTITLGSLNPVGNAVYAKSTAGADVLLIGGYFLTALDFELRQMPAVSGSNCRE